MHCLEKKIPKSNNKAKKIMAKKLTEVLSETTGMPSDIFGIHFNEYEIGEVASDGKICNGLEEKPYIYFQFYGPRLKKKSSEI